MELSFPCDGKCTMSVELDIHGQKYETDVLIDTGFTTGTGYGLKLSRRASLLASSVGYDLIRLADDRIIQCATISDAKLLGIGNRKLARPITLPTLFFNGPKVIGMRFLQLCKLSIDGRKRIGTLEIEQ